MKSLIIIPAYNEEACIEQTVRDILEHAPNFDYIVINDCSKDRTKEICEKNQFHYIDLPVNLGIGGAVQTGYKYACNHGYDYAVQVDGDGQHDPRFLEGFQSSGLRRTGIKYFTWLIRLLTGKTITDPTSGLRMINKDIIQYFAKEYPRDYPEPESIVAVLKRKKKVQEIPVIMRARAGGVSSISPLNSIYYMVKVTIAILIERIR